MAGTAGMEGSPEAPLWARMTESMPGITTSIGFTGYRGANTLMRGGYMDSAGTGRMARGFNRVTGNTARRANKYRTIQNGALTESRAGQFFGSKGVMGKRAGRLAQMEDKAGFLKSARVNNITMRPRAFNRYNTLSVFSNQGTYSPFNAGQMLGKSKKVQGAFSKAGIEAGEGESLFGKGTLSFITAGQKIDRLERKALKGSGRALKKLGTVDGNIKALAGMNNPGMVAGIDQTLARGLSSEAIGVRGNLMASSAGGPGSRAFAGYARGATGRGILRGAAETEADFIKRGAAKGLSGEALMKSEQAIKTFGVGLEKAGINVGGKVGAEAAEVALREGVFKTLGTSGVKDVLMSGAGRKALGVRAASLAIPGLNVVAAVSMAYDLGKMGGELVKSGINLTKDAVKSMKGDIKKPIFGSVFKDNEAAATSRSRGVMAIQNSQLNARSALGNEGSMMAAHFG